MELGQGTDAFNRRQRRLLTRPRDQLPEALRTQVKEGHGQVAPPIQRHDQRPIEAKEINQVITRFNQVSGDQSLSKEIDDGEQEQRFVGGAVAGGRHPVGAVGGGVKMGEGVAVYGQEIKQWLIKF